MRQRTSHGKGGEDANGGSYAWKSRLGQTEDIKGYIIYIYLIAGDVNLNPIVRVVSSWSLHCKVTKINRYFVVDATQF